MKMDLALNNLQWLMCHKTKANRWVEANVLDFDILVTEFEFQ